MLVLNIYDLGWLSKTDNPSGMTEEWRTQSWDWQSSFIYIEGGTYSEWCVGVFVIHAGLLLHIQTMLSSASFCPLSWQLIHGLSNRGLIRPLTSRMRWRSGNTTQSWSHDLSPFKVCGGMTDPYGDNVCGLNLERTLLLSSNMLVLSYKYNKTLTCCALFYHTSVVPSNILDNLVTPCNCPCIMPILTPPLGSIHMRFS